MAQTLDSLVVELKADIKGLQASLRTASGEIQKFSGTSEKQVTAFTSAIDKAKVTALALAGAWAGFKVGKDIVDAGMQMQALTNRMIAATGDAKTAGEAMAFVRAESERLGLSFQNTANGFAGFAASALRGGLTMKQTQEIFTGVSEAATSLHLSGERVQLVFTALEQMAAKGTVQMEELRGQLGESLPGAFELAAKAMGVTTQELGNMMSKGEVISSDFLPKFAQSLRENMTGSLDEATKSAQAALSRLGNAYFDLKVKMADAGILDAVTQAVQQMTATLKDPAVQSGLIEFARLLGNIATAALRATAAIGNFFATASSRKQAMADLAKEGKAWTPDNIEQRVRSNSSTTSGAGGAAKQVGPVSMLPGNDMTASLDTGTMSDASLSGGATPGPMTDANLSVGGQGDDPYAAMLQQRLASLRNYSAETLSINSEKNAALKGQDESYWGEAQSGLEGFLGIQLRTTDEIGKDSIATQGQNLRTTLQQAAQHNKTFFLIEKAAAIARALVAARESVVSAYNFGSRLGGPVLGAVFAGVAAAAQAANIAAIASASYGGSGGGGGAAVSSSSYTPSGANQPTDGLGRPIQDVRPVYISIEGGDRAVFDTNQLRGLVAQLNEVQKDGSRLELHAA